MCVDVLTPTHRNPHNCIIGKNYNPRPSNSFNLKDTKCQRWGNKWPSPREKLFVFF